MRSRKSGTNILNELATGDTIDQETINRMSKKKIAASPDLSVISPLTSGVSPIPQDKPKEGYLPFKNSDKTSDHSSNDAYDAKMMITDELKQ